MAGDSSRGIRLLAGGCLWVVIIAGFLFMVGSLLFSVMVTSFFDRPSEPDKARSEAATRYYLEEYAGDGTLTSEEITSAARGGQWHQETDDTTIRITVTYSAEGGSSVSCYRFVLQRPLNLDTQVALPPLGEGCEGAGGG